MSLHKFADMVASQGRGDDSLLIHMTPDEVQRLQSFAEANGRSLTINPETGLPEAGMLSDLFKAVAPIALGAFLGPGAFGIAGLGLSAGTAGLVTGGLTTLATGSLSRGLMAGLGAYSGAGLAGSFADAGANALGAEGAAGALGVEGAATGAGSQAAMLAEQTAGFGSEGLTRLADSARVATGASPVVPSASSLVSKGFDVAAADPLGFAKQNWKPIAAAALPVLGAIQTTTPAQASKPTDTGYIRQKIVNQDGTVTDLTPVKASEWGDKNFSDVYRGYNGGGIVALAGGGNIDQILADAARLRAATASTAPTQAVAVPGVVDVTKPGQYVTDPATGNAVALSAYSPGFDPNNKITQTYLGELAAKGGTDTTSQMFNQMGASQAQQDTNAAAWKVEEDRLKAIDAANAAKAPTGLATLNQNQNLTNQNAGLAAIPADASYTTRFFAERGLGFDPIDRSIDNFLATYQTQLAAMTPKQQEDAMRAALNTERMNEADVVKATGKTIAQLIQQKRADGSIIVPGKLDEVPVGSLPGGVSGASNTAVNANGTITTRPDIPGIGDGFTGMTDVRNAYTKGGGSTGYVSPAPRTMAEFEQMYNKQTGDSLAAYNYLMGKEGAKYPTNSTVGEIEKPYRVAALGYPDSTNKMYNWDAATGRMVRNPDYVAPGRDAKGNVTYGMSLNDIKKALVDTPMTGQTLYDWAQENNLSAQQIADATGRTLSSVYSDFRAGAKAAAKKAEADKAAGINTLVDGGGGGDSGGPGGPGGSGTGPGGVGGAGGPGSTSAVGAGDIGGMDSVDAEGGYYSRGKLHYRSKDMAMGGSTGYAVGGGLGSLGSYSDGGRLLKGPGDGVSDSIPATIGAKQQPARLADGEFVIPARIVSELGNGSTDAGAKKLYAMMDRVQKARGKTTGKNKVAANSRADKYLPA